MPDMKQIHNFAVKWCDKFRDQNINYIDLVDHYMADDCAALGFEMDCGHAFSEKYGQAANNHEALNRIIYDVTDIDTMQATANTGILIAMFAAVIITSAISAFVGCKMLKKQFEKAGITA